MTESHDIYADVSALLVKLFEIDPEDIKPEARLYETWSWIVSTRSI